MQSFKTGYLLNASVRLQFYGLLIGTFFSVFFSVLSYYLFITVYPNMPNDEFEIPSLPPTPPLGEETQQIVPHHGYSATSLTSLGNPTPIHSAIDNAPHIENIPVLPLNITPVSHISHGTGAFTRISATHSADTPTTPLHLTGIVVIIIFWSPF